jgi:nickel/cobalt transporter (NicO) family protein
VRHCTAPMETGAAIEPSVADSSKSLGGYAAPPALPANQQATPRSKFTELVSTRNLSFWFLFTSALIAAGLGALHALEPGHGKTVVAAYLAPSRMTSFCPG